MEHIFNEDESPLDINKMEFLSNRGSEFIVYKYLNEVIKIYKKDYQLPPFILRRFKYFKKYLNQKDIASNKYFME